MSEEVKGTKALKETIHLVLATMSAVQSAKADGHIGLEDLGLLVQLAPAVSPVLSDGKDVPAELKDLSAEEAADVVTFVMSELSISDEHARAVVDEALKTVAQVVKLVRTIQSK